MENMNPSTATPSSAVKYSSFNVPLDSIYLELMQTMCISIGNLIKIEEKCYWKIRQFRKSHRCTWFSCKLCKHRNLLLSLDCMLRSFRVIWTPMEMKLKKLVLFISKRSAIKYVLFFCQINFKFHFWNAKKHKWLRLSWIHYLQKNNKLLYQMNFTCMTVVEKFSFCNYIPPVRRKMNCINKGGIWRGKFSFLKSQIDRRLSLTTCTYFVSIQRSPCTRALQVILKR